MCLIVLGGWRAAPALLLLRGPFVGVVVVVQVVTVGSFRYMGDGDGRQVLSLPPDLWMGPAFSRSGAAALSFRWREGLPFSR